MHKLRFLLALSAMAGMVHAQDFRRESMPDSSGRVHPDYVLGVNAQRWSGMQINWYYNPANQPGNLDTNAVINAIKVGAARWSGMCNITFNYLGLSSNAPNMYGDSSTVDQVSVFGWGVLQGSDSVYSALTKTWFIGSNMIDADIMMNITQSWTITEVEGIMTHELGHALGLNHSNEQQSVMFANPYNPVTYMRTLRGDDAYGCAILYGAASTARANRVFNWAEATYPQYLAPSLAASGTQSGYYYRYYPDTNSYVGSKDGISYYMGPDGVIHDMGSESSNWLKAAIAGY